MHLNVALLQLEARARDPRANLERGLRACREAKRDGAHVALFPEIWSIGYDLREGEPVDVLARHAIDVDDPFLASYATLAAELDLVIAVTFLQRWPGRPRNAVAVFDRLGELTLLYAKVHTCDWDREAVLTPGDRFVVSTVETAVGPVGMGAMICFDLLFPEAARALMLEGAEIILMPNACSIEPWRLAVLQTRAIENMVAVAMANYPGTRTGGRFCAFVPMAYPMEGQDEPAPFDPTVIRAGAEPGIYMARIDVERLRRFRQQETQGDAYRKPSTYSALLRTEVRSPFARLDARR
jgi:predicted amidohydrolase